MNTFGIHKEQNKQISRVLENFIPKSQVIQKAEESDNKGGEHWITVNGRHILIGGSGEVKQGGKGMSGGGDLKKVGGSKKDYRKVGDKTYHKDDIRYKNKMSEKGRADAEKEYAQPGSQAYKEHGLGDKPSNKDLAATEFESTYSKKEAKKYAEGGEPKTKAKENNDKNNKGSLSQKDFPKSKSVKYTIKNDFKSKGGDPIDADKLPKYLLGQIMELTNSSAEKRKAFNLPIDIEPVIDNHFSKTAGEYDTVMEKFIIAAIKKVAIGKNDIKDGLLFAIKSNKYGEKNKQLEYQLSAYNKYFGDNLTLK